MAWCDVILDAFRGMRTRCIIYEASKKYYTIQKGLGSFKLCMNPTGIRYSLYNRLIANFLYINVSDVELAGQ